MRGNILDWAKHFKYGECKKALHNKHTKNDRSISRVQLNTTHSIHSHYREYILFKSCSCRYMCTAHIISGARQSLSHRHTHTVTTTRSKLVLLVLLSFPSFSHTVFGAVHTWTRGTVAQGLRPFVHESKQLITTVNSFEHRRSLTIVRCCKQSSNWALGSIFGFRSKYGFVYSLRPCCHHCVYVCSAV